VHSEQRLFGVVERTARRAHFVRVIRASHQHASARLDVATLAAVRDDAHTRIC
jgi:hypothetical protein